MQGPRQGLCESDVSEQNTAQPTTPAEQSGFATRPGAAASAARALEKAPAEQAWKGSKAGQEEEEIEGVF